MKIDDNWKDGYLYYIEFKAQVSLVEDRVICKNIILFDYYDKTELEKIIINRFRNVIRVLSIDFLEETLIEK